jgi:hypothetical protein
MKVCVHAWMAIARLAMYGLQFHESQCSWMMIMRLAMYGLQFHESQCSWMMITRLAMLKAIDLAWP